MINKEISEFKIKSLTPLRYPGGKSRLQKYILPYIKDVVYKNDISQIEFYEPFTGGGSISLTMALNFPNMKIHLNDLNYDVFNFWNFIVNSTDLDFKLLLNKLDIKPTLKLFYKLVDQDTMGNNLESATKFLILNKTSFAGMGNNPIGGKDQNSRKIDCQYTHKRISTNLIKARNLLKGRTSITNQNVLKFSDTKNIYYFDPPYYEIGNSHYTVGMDNNEHIKLAEKLKGWSNFVLSYNNCDEIRELYSWAKIIEIDTIYTSRSRNKTTIPKSKELIIVKK